MPSSRQILFAVSSAATVLAFASSAQAATVATLPCVPSGISVGLGSAKNMPVSGTGFTPGALVTVRYASTVSPSPSFLTAVTADAAGNFAAQVSPPIFAKFDTQEQDFALSATDGTNPALVATATYKQVRVGYTKTPPTGRPSRVAKHTVRGFPVGKATYLHFRFGGKTRRNVKLGTTSSPCGIVSRRMALLPTRSRAGKWTVYVDQAKTYSKTSLPQLKYSFLISRTFGSP